MRDRARWPVPSAFALACVATCGLGAGVSCLPRAALAPTRRGGAVGGAAWAHPYDAPASGHSDVASVGV
eukprot:5454953-Pleurochrysis_carterae.AAC.1